MSKKLVAFIIFVALLIILAGAGLVADANYGAVRSSPRISHETLAKPQTRALVVIDTPKTKDFIKQQLLKDVPVPGWVLPLALPHEAALIVDVDYEMNGMDLTLFVNDKRLGPVIRDKMNGVQLPAPLNQWFTSPAKLEARGKIIRKGGATLNHMLLARVEDQWADAAVSDRLRVQGGHMLEVVLDNRDGAAIAILGSIAAAQGLPLDEMTLGRLGMVRDLASLRLQADLLPDDSAKLHLELACRPGADPMMVQILGSAVEFGYGFAVSQAQLVGVKVSGGSEVKGTVIQGEYTLSNLGPLLAML